MDDVFVYCIRLPAGIDEMVLPCADGYTVYISDQLDQEHRIKAYHHALRHIRKRDIEKRDVQLIEMYAHKGGEKL